MSPEGRRKIMTEARSETRPVTDQPTYSDLAMALGGTGAYRTGVRRELKGRESFIDSLTEAWKSHEIEFQYSKSVGYVWKSLEDTPAGGSSTFVVCAMGKATDGGPRYLDGGRTALTDSDTTYALSLVAGASGTALHTSGPTWATYCTTHNQFVVEFPYPSDAMAARIKVRATWKDVWRVTNAFGAEMEIPPSPGFLRGDHAVLSKEVTVTVKKDTDTSPPIWAAGDSLSLSATEFSALGAKWPAASSLVGVASYDVYVDGVYIDTVPDDGPWVIRGLPAGMHVVEVLATDTYGHTTLLGRGLSASSYPSRPLPGLGATSTTGIRAPSLIGGVPSTSASTTGIMLPPILIHIGRPNPLYRALGLYV